ncbi:hypothetical protein [Rhodopirellula sp. MGV]|uniref:hypothetical protein n=1 Tax=Rhodopirellula sp. MGV TaxID=2023130 RepID=UPI000BCDAA3B|nr:hypothetical protein [Rhodopirellula sp. MGV]OYP37522.1 hypothetical protein CGZ80_05200 [Rhodopirellula sp. MGV]
MIESFTERVLRILQREFASRRFELGDEPGVITDGTVTYGMSNLFAQYRQGVFTDEDFDEAICEKFTQILQLLDSASDAIPERWEDAKDRLRVQLVSAKLTNLSNAITFPFADDVHASLVIDSEGGYAYIRQVDLDRWQQTAIDAIELGKRNIVASMPQLPLAVMPGEVRLAVIQTGDGYDAARILIPEVRLQLIQELTGEPTGEVYAAVPNRDFFIAWPTDIAPPIHAQLVETVILDSQRQSHPLSERIFRITGEKIDLQ